MSFCVCVREQTCSAPPPKEVADGRGAAAMAKHDESIQARVVCASAAGASAGDVGAEQRSEAGVGFASHTCTCSPPAARPFPPRLHAADPLLRARPSHVLVYPPSRSLNAQRLEGEVDAVRAQAQAGRQQASATLREERAVNAAFASELLASQALARRKAKELKRLEGELRRQQLLLARRHPALGVYDAIAVEQDRFVEQNGEEALDDSGGEEGGEGEGGEGWEEAEGRGVGGEPSARSVGESSSAGAAGGPRHRRVQRQAGGGRGVGGERGRGGGRGRGRAGQGGAGGDVRRGGQGAEEGRSAAPAGVGAAAADETCMLCLVVADD